MKAIWEGWDGLHFELERKTLLGQRVPGVTIWHRTWSIRAT
ncbi:MAG TPA: hypothetical protein P5525_25010 [Candidatus Paceibacterota bacterium]|nr:hypothetical protein [Candidatus Paceibacterota bacterium]